MKKAVFLAVILSLTVLSTACINKLAIQELNSKAQEYMNKGDYDKAIGRLESSIDLDSSVFESQYNLAVAYTNAEKYEEAFDAYKKAIELNPEFSEAYYSFAVAQENFANDIIAGTSKKQEAVAKDEDKDSAVETGAAYKPTNDELKEAILLYNDAAENYKKFESKPAEKNKEKEDVSSKITYLEAQVKKLMSEVKE